MKKILLIIAVIVVFAFLMSNMPPAFVKPVAAEGGRSGSGIKMYEFNDLFERNRSFSKLTKEGYYTVIEGYLNTCTICKRLESDFKPFLKQRKDILIRRVHFSETGNSINFSAETQEEYDRQVADYFERMSTYHFVDVVKTDKDYKISMCGTPYIEIYGPDRQLIVRDECGENQNKSGLNYLRKWISAETSQ